MRKNVRETRGGPGRPRRDRTRISSKNQVTLPVSMLDAAGLGSGDTLRVAARDPQARSDPRAGRDCRFAGRLTGVYGPRYLDDLRDEWD